jgi:DHA2 family multidrug resistance protein
MSYGDVFFLLTLFYVGLSLLVMLLKAPKMMGAPADAH